MTRLGRRPQGARLVESLAGSAHARQRLRLFLQTLAGEKSVVAACAELGIVESRFYDQRAAWLAHSLEMLEPRAAGRPPKPLDAAAPEEVAALRRRVRELEARAVAVGIQADLARTLPHVLRRRRWGKKTPRRVRPASFPAAAQGG
jgi:hypothetical protein